AQKTRINSTLDIWKTTQIQKQGTSVAGEIGVKDGHGETPSQYEMNSNPHPPVIEQPASYLRGRKQRHSGTDW
ncbi:hypothetical protein ACJMK2_005592, partial [Sinanodonta woodiana]